MGPNVITDRMISNDPEGYDDVAQWDLSLPDGKHTVRLELTLVS